jgi:hypothetical protein
MIVGSSMAASGCKHFREPDGSIACVCMECLRTLAMNKSEADLHRNRVVHLCSPGPRADAEPSIPGRNFGEEVSP